MINLDKRCGTQNIRIFEIDSCIFYRISRVEEHFTLPVELDGVGGFIDTIIFFNQGEIAYFFSLDSDILFAQILDVIHVEAWDAPQGF